MRKNRGSRREKEGITEGERDQETGGKTRGKGER